ncbi:hypothetical protein R50072_38070 [Simiduia litorea]|uniref:hypothetical protein n=1 Tax=Simiduia litorea TaxID=1435348 RepID=UPI0036F3180C
MDCFQIISLIKDLILAGVAITGAVVAVKGLGTWQRQLKGQSEYDLSRRILIGLYRYRDAINRVRNPVMWPYEMPYPTDEEAKGMDQRQIRFYGTSKAYQARWEKVQDEKTILNTDLLEAEAIWGNRLDELFKKVFTLESELFTKIRRQMEIANPDTDGARREAVSKLDNNSRDIMYDLSTEDPDEFKRDLLAAIATIETYLKPKLSHE